METLLSNPIFLQDMALAGTGGFILKLVVNAVALMLAAMLLSNVEIKGFTSAAIVALVLALLNATIGEYLTDFTGWSKGILSFVVDAVVILIASALMDGFKVKGFLTAFLLAILLTFINGFLYQIVF